MLKTAAESKIRLDQEVFARGLSQSREQARRLILAGKILVNDQLADHPGTKVPVGAAIRLRGPDHPYVGRGGVKLATALDAFGVDPRGMMVADFGASTGGFTDCLLRRGARTVFAIDVGYGQIDWRLREDSRVVVLERTNVRYLDPDRLDGRVDLITIDVSFISILKVLPAAMSVLADIGRVLVLVKPQFEIGKGRVGKGGVVRKAEDHREVLNNLVNRIPERGFGVEDLTASPLRGPKGNLEFWLHLLPGKPNHVTEDGTNRVVDEAHQQDRVQT